MLYFTLCLLISISSYSSMFSYLCLLVSIIVYLSPLTCLFPIYLFAHACLLISVCLCSCLFTYLRLLVFMLVNLSLFTCIHACIHISVYLYSCLLTCLRLLVFMLVNLSICRRVSWDPSTNQGSAGHSRAYLWGPWRLQENPTNRADSVSRARWRKNIIKRLCMWFFCIGQTVLTRDCKCFRIFNTVF